MPAPATNTAPPVTVRFIVDSQDPANVQSFKALENFKDPDRSGLVIIDAAQDPADPNILIVTLAPPPA